MSSRMSKDEVGEFIPGPNGGSYRIKRVPLPPLVNVSIKEEVWENRIREVVSIKCACVHCMKDVEIQYVAAEASRNFAQELQHSVNREFDRLYRHFEEKKAHDQQLVATSYLESLDQWNS